MLLQDVPTIKTTLADVFDTYGFSMHFVFIINSTWQEELVA